MNQALNLSSIRFWEPVETPAPISATHLIAQDTQAHIVTEAVAFAWSDDLPSWYKGRWIIRQRDTAKNLVRESTETFANARLASWHFWFDREVYGEAVAFEPWVAPIWASFVEAA